MTLTDKRILGVDDHVANIDLMVDLLDEHGFTEVTGLEDARRVVEQCRALSPDLLLLDIRMPHMDGYAVIDALHRELGEATPPIIVLTAQIDDETRQRALALGVRDFLTKPFKHDEVIQRIENALRVEQRYEQRDDEAQALERLVEARTHELEVQSRTDSVTGLINRRGILQRLTAMQSAGGPVGVIFITVGGLDEVALLHCHTTADQLIERLAAIMGASHDARAALGRWGGNEFVLLTPEADPASLEHTAHQLHACVADDIAVGDLLLPVTLRMGMSVASESMDPNRLVQMAALAIPPLSHRIRTRMYDAGIEAAERHRLTLQQALRGAHERGEMHLAFQPKIRLSDGRIIGAEALLRWIRPDDGPVSPGVFIPMAEASGEILAIGDWVIDQAIEYATRWRTHAWAEGAFDLALNVAARQLAQPRFAARLIARLQTAGLPTDRISLEITESGLMEDLSHARAQLQQLDAHGVNVAIDDFGTGHSSLAYLRDLRFSTLKIDRAFVMELPENAVDRELAETITGLAHGFGCHVVAEGVETAAQAEYLQTIGCETAQGFLYARPMDAAAFTQWCESIAS